ncbi:MAG: RdgB/HAM1 family non-canonical purine NTP pyrophosphatase [Chloroflexota bacterium]
MTRSSNPALVIATRNPGKVREFQRMLSDLPFRILSLDDAGVSATVEETGTTFLENATLKARGYAEASGLLTLAEDSGLEVDALGGAPGVYSARYARQGQTDEEGVQKLLEEMEDVPGWKRQARYRAVIAIAGPPLGDEVKTFEGACEGAISHVPAGDGGFGYDPVFWVPAARKTAAEMRPEEKDAISHRGAAARSAAQFLRSLTL